MTIVPYNCTFPNVNLPLLLQKKVRITKLTNSSAQGETPFWDEESRSLFFVDVTQGTVLRYEVDTEKLYSVKLGT